MQEICTSDWSAVASFHEGMPKTDNNSSTVQLPCFLW